MAGIVAIPLVARTYPTDPKESRRLLEAAVDVVGEPDFPIDTIFRLVNEVEHLVAHDPALVSSIFEHVFGFEERSEAQTNMGGPVLPLFSNRRQDYDSCRYSLIQEFPNFLAAAPREAVRAAVRSIQAFVLERHVRPYLRKDKKLEEIAEAFPFRGQTVRYIHDGASIWDKTSYPDQEMALADAVFDWLAGAAEAGRAADLELMILVASSSSATCGGSANAMRTSCGRCWGRSWRPKRTRSCSKARRERCGSFGNEPSIPSTTSAGSDSSTPVSQSWIKSSASGRKRTRGRCWRRRRTISCNC